MLKDIFTALWVFLPVGLGNTAPVFATKLPVIKNFSYPLDFYARFSGKRLLGSHKTIRGLIAAVIVGVTIALIQFEIFNNSPALQAVITIDNYGQTSPFIFGSLAGLGGILGDAVKSFFKRQKDIAPGKTWFPFDQLDYIIGGIVFLSFCVSWQLPVLIWIVIVWFLMHPLSTVIGFWLKLKDKPI